MKKTCFFIGHRDASDTIYPALLAEVGRHIAELGVGEFIVGHYGRFDSLAVRAVKEVEGSAPGSGADPAASLSSSKEACPETRRL